MFLADRTGERIVEIVRKPLKGGVDDSSKHLGCHLPDPLVDRDDASGVDQIVLVRVISHEFVLGFRELQSARRSPFDFCRKRWRADGC